MRDVILCSTHYNSMMLRKVNRGFSSGASNRVGSKEQGVQLFACRL